MGTAPAPLRLNSVSRLAALALVSLVAAACSSSATPAEPGPATGSRAEQASGATVDSPSPEAPAVVAQGVSDAAADPSPSPRQDRPLTSVVRKYSNPDGAQVDDGFFVQLISRDGIAPIYEPTVRTPDEVTELGPRELVIGVSVNGQSRAYPIRPLRFREMVNDELGGVPILVTW